MDDESIIALYWQRDQRAITETDTKYGALCRTVASGILRASATHISPHGTPSRRAGRSASGHISAPLSAI